MIRSDFEESFPRLADALVCIAVDSGMTLLEEFDVEGMDEDFLAHDAKLMEMSDQEFETFCMGERSETEAIIEKYNAKSVDIFLEYVFDGQYNHCFFV